MTARPWSTRTTLTAVLALGALLTAGLSAMAEPGAAGPESVAEAAPDGASSQDTAVLSAEAEESAELAAEQGVDLERAVLEELDEQGATDFWVGFEDRADLSGAEEIEDWAERGQYVYDHLVETARASQAELTIGLTALSVDHEAFWISNTVLVRGGDQSVLDGVLEQPEVAEVRADEAVELPEPVEGSDEASIQAVEWGVANIRADQVWNDLGVRGEGIVVGSIDTGVEYTHPALVNQYRGNLGGGAFDHNYNWWDPAQVCDNSAPCDNNNHGTHTTGTMVGDDGAGNQIGVAPRAQWIAAKGCESNSCSNAALLSSGQFMLAPTDLAGQNARPGLRPHIVNNSWGDPNGPAVDPFFRDVVTAWTSAGIFGVFSNGNSGPGCDTSGSPGDQIESWSVGAHDSGNTIASFSSRGSGENGEIKPSISAPGVNVRSSTRFGRFANFSGTSMAAPHTSGAVALMWSASGQLGDIAATREALDATAVDTEDLSCGGTRENNNVYGQGRLDALEAVQETVIDSGVAGTVRDADTAIPISQVRVEVVETGMSTSTGSDGTFRLTLQPGTYTLEFSYSGHLTSTMPSVIVEDGAVTTVDAVIGGLKGHVVDIRDGESLSEVTVEVVELGIKTQTDAEGEYKIRLGPGTYTLRFSQFSYRPATVPDVVVAANAFTGVSVELERAPAGAIAGRVTDEASGHTVPGVTVEVLGVPVDYRATTDADGSYEITGVPVGTYDIRATTTRPGLWEPLPAVTVTIGEGSATPVDFRLPIAAGVERVSISSDGEEANGRPGSGAGRDAISDDGRYVAFYSYATNLVDVPVSAPGQPGDEPLVAYLHDRHTGVTELLPDSRWRLSMTGDGRYVTSLGEPNLVEELRPERPPVPRFLGHISDNRVYVRDRLTGENELVSVNSNGEVVGVPSRIGVMAQPDITPDGRYVAFTSDAGHLSDDEPAVCHAFFELSVTPCAQVAVHDRDTGESEVVSVNSDGEPANRSSAGTVTITPDGRYVAFVSEATNLVDAETNPGDDIFVHDRKTGTTEWVSVLEASSHNGPAMSDDGRFVAYDRGFFGSAVHDRATGETELLSVPIDDPAFLFGASAGATISADGRFVAFDNTAVDQSFEALPEGTGLFVRDRQNGQLERLVNTADGSPWEPAGFSLEAISPDARFGLFGYAGSNLVAGDTNGVPDSYVVDRAFDPSEPHPRFAVWDLSVEPSSPLPGEPVAVTAHVKNVGDATGDYDAILLVDSVREPSTTETVTLAPGEASEVTLTLAREAGGSYSVRIGQAAGEFRVQSGTLTGTVSNANDGFPVEGATITATNGVTERAAATGQLGDYELADLQVGTWTLTVAAEDHDTETTEVSVTADGQQLTRDLTLRTGAATPTPQSISASVVVGTVSTVDVDLTNVGTADLAWNAFGWAATTHETPAILAYSSRTATDTHIDQALQRLGLDHTFVRETQPCTPFGPAQGEGMERFGETLIEREWDLVIVDHACLRGLIPPSTEAALATHVASGGRLILNSQQFGRESDTPLWQRLGAELRDTLPPPSRDPFAVYWWAANHPLFTEPLPVPEFIADGRHLYNTLDGFDALAGYTLGPRPDHAAMVIGNGDRTLLSGFFEQDGTDLDGNGVPDGVQLWVNSIVHIGGLAVQPWLNVEESRTLTPGSSQDVTVSLDASALEPGTYTGTVELVTDAAREPQVTVPVTLEVTEAAPVTFDSLRDSVEAFEADGDVTKAGAARLLSAVDQAERHHDRGVDARAIIVLERFQETAGDPKFVPSEAARDALVADAGRLIAQLREGLSDPGATAPAEGEVVPV